MGVGGGGAILKGRPINRPLDSLWAGNHRQKGCSEPTESSSPGRQDPWVPVVVASPPQADLQGSHGFARVPGSVLIAGTYQVPGAVLLCYLNVTTPCKLGVTACISLVKGKGLRESSSPRETLSEGQGSDSGSLAQGLQMGPLAKSSLQMCSLCPTQCFLQS